MSNTQVETNHEVYEKSHREQVERDHPGKTVLMHDGEIVDILEDQGTAYRTGVERYGLGNFTLILVGEKPVHMGALTVNIG